ncbi:MAG: carotenoid biosynthesis protein [Bacteroidota bacterium]|nr:carotenoid biosynthesis protein [Bacteroidota bacterium]
MKRLPNDQIVRIIVVVWYLVGIAGFLNRPLQPLFQKLIPFGMVAAVVLLMYFHEPKNLKNWLVFSGIVLLGFLVELIGVNTQALFGFYKYGNSLGPKIWNTPLVIGINWLVLVYCISALAKPIRDTWYFPLLGAFAMVVFDWLMEPVAIATDMWYWVDNSIPGKNYLDWFLISGFLFLMIRILKVEINNRIAGVVLLMQFIFFLALNLLMQI